MDRSLLAVAAVALGLLLFQSAHAAVPPIKQPSWVELNVEQREILAPLASEWDQLEFWRRKKWLSIADHYPAMKAEEQARVQKRMAEWVKLSPGQRELAREKFRRFQKASPGRKQSLRQKWQEFKDLPPEERQRLEAEAAAWAAKRKAAPPRSLAPADGQKPAGLPLPGLSPEQPQSVPAPTPPVAPSAPNAPPVPPAATP